MPRMTARPGRAIRRCIEPDLLAQCRTIQQKTWRLIERSALRQHRRNALKFPSRADAPRVLGHRNDIEARLEVIEELCREIELVTPRQIHAGEEAQLGRVFFSQEI